jgi:hypothetical protein
LSSVALAAETAIRRPCASTWRGGCVQATAGIGEITDACREKAAIAGQHEWVFFAPSASLQDRAGQSVGLYFGAPATWTQGDGSALTGAQRRRHRPPRAASRCNW